MDGEISPWTYKAIFGSIALGLREIADAIW
jgi:hypothetical protein